MGKATPSSKIPHSKGYMAPEIKRETKSLPHYKVNGVAFLSKSKANREAKNSGAVVVKSDDYIEVYEVNEENFATYEEATKKHDLLLRKHRDKLRSASRIFGVDKASLAEKNPYLKWLLESYSVDEIFSAYDTDGLLSRYGFVLPIHRSFLQEHQELDASSIGYERKWLWLQNRNIDPYWGIPEEYQEVGPLRSAWVDGEGQLRKKVDLIDRLIDMRMLELLHYTYYSKLHYTNSGLPSLQVLKESVDLDLLISELKDIIRVLNGTELGADLHIEFEAGEVKYSIVGFEKEINPFKRF